MRVNLICSVVGILFHVTCLLHVVFSWKILGYEPSMPDLPKWNSIQKFVRNPYCNLYECCNDEQWINFRKQRLVANLTDHVYGQPLLDTVVDALSSHFNPNFQPKKALTFSFHGMTGTGKNYVTRFIADSMFTNGMKSKFVHHFFARLHFSETRLLNEYQANLYSWLKGNISDCPKQLFIFDEVDKMIPNLLDYIKPMIDYIEDVEGVNYSRAVFIFLSNTAADVIREHYHDLYIQGKNRDDLKLSDFEQFIQKGAFNEQGGLFRGNAISNNLIDHYIPFLPLERKHIRMCIQNEFRIRKVLNPQEVHIDDAMDVIEWGPADTRLFSKTGCKRLGPKVAMIVDRHYRHLTFRDEL